MEKFLSIAWEVLKVAVIPLCIWYFEDDERKKIYEAQQKKNTDVQFLMMERIDSLSDMTQMMARKLHDAGIINGDLEDMHRKYEGLNNEYEKNIKSLALKVLNK